MQSGREPAPSARSRAECFRHSEETKASLPVAPPRVTVRNQRSCPDSRPSRRLWVSQGEDPPLSTPIDGAGNGPPVSRRPRQPGLPESGLAGTTGPAVAFGHEGSHWRHGVPCVQSPVQPPTPTNRWSPPARPPHRCGRLCTKSPRTRAPCRVPSRTLTRRPSPAPPCGDSGSGVVGGEGVPGGAEVAHAACSRALLRVPRALLAMPLLSSKLT